MIKFKEHDGLIFKMLDKPVPLTTDAEMPCMVRFRMPFSERFRGKHEGVALFCDAIKKNPLYGNRLYAYETRKVVGCIAEPRELEIIGTPVKEGSEDWAWYQMMKGEKISYAEMISQRFYAIKKGCDYCAFYGSDGNEVSINTRRTYDEFIEYSKRFGISSWQIYEKPKPEPQYKVGDFVEIINQYSGTKHLGQIDSIDHEIHIGTHRFNTNGNSAMETLPQLNIIRKLKPSEVVVEIGCLSGTVRPVSTNGTHIWFHLIGVDDKTIATIRISCLDTPTRELVEGLLEAQEEGE